VLVTGAAGALGRRVCALLDAAPDVGRIVALDLRAPRPALAPPHEFRAADLATAELGPLLEGVDQVVHLAFAVGPEVDEAATARSNVVGTRRLLDAAGAAGVDRVVLMSSASVYGAWAANPVPLTEEAPVRPNTGFSYAFQKAEIERLGWEWAAEHPEAAVSVLRPAVALGSDDESWLSRSLRPAARLRAGDGDPPVQFVHLDDLASAVDVVRRQRLAGPVNVAADGWMTGEELRALEGAPPRLPVPEPVLAAWASFAWRRRLSRMAPGIVPYVVHPWVVANDRLEAAGWKARYSNAEAIVESRPGSPWSTLSPKRRQEILLSVAGGATLLAVGGAAAVARRAVRRASGGSAPLLRGVRPG
jgi:UDP-glucose 4-epimerase